MHVKHSKDKMSDCTQFSFLENLWALLDMSVFEYPIQTFVCCNWEHSHLQSLASHCLDPLNAATNWSVPECTIADKLRAYLQTQQWHNNRCQSDSGAVPLQTLAPFTFLTRHVFSFMSEWMYFMIWSVSYLPKQWWLFQNTTSFPLSCLISRIKKAKDKIFGLIRVH